MKTILFPGSFDPFTRGHAALVERALALFDTVVVAVGVNAGKAGWLSPDQRAGALRRLYAGEPRVRVVVYSDLTADCARREGAQAILRGVRTVKDYEYEMQMADVHRQLAGIETVCLFAHPALAAVSSSLVRELAGFGRDVAPFLPTGYGPLPQTPHTTQ